VRKPSTPIDGVFNEELQRGASIERLDLAAILSLVNDRGKELEPVSGQDAAEFVGEGRLAIGDHDDARLIER
jgi:hypothetical protein